MARAGDLLTDFADLAVQRWPFVDGLRQRAFQLRDNVSAYVALVEALECLLLTRDSRLALQRARCSHRSPLAEGEVEVAAWRAVVESEPDFAQRVQKIMDAHLHKTMATLRADGSPRISGIEASFVEGQLWFGSMLGARKGDDLRRDPRFALHSASVDPPKEDGSRWSGDAKLSGRAVRITDPDELTAALRSLGTPPDQSAELFRADIGEVVLTRVGDPPDHLVIELWRPGRPLHRIERR